MQMGCTVSSYVALIATGFVSYKRLIAYYWASRKLVIKSGLTRQKMRNMLHKDCKNYTNLAGQCVPYLQ